MLSSEGGLRRNGGLNKDRGAQLRRELTQEGALNKSRELTQTLEPNQGGSLTRAGGSIEERA